jgi:hypothetical protein
VKLTPTGFQQISTKVVVALLGSPLAQDLTVTLSADPSSTATPNMYTLGSTSLVIPAGKASATTTLTSVSANMPIGQVVNLVLNLSAGGNEAGTAAQVTYKLLRPVVCLPVPGVWRIEMHDSYGDGWQTNASLGGNGIKVTIDGVVTEVGMCSPYQASPYPNCVAGDYYNATAFVTVPDPSFNIKWNFAGDWYGEISFEIYDPSNNKVYSRPQVVDRTGGGDLPFQVCL